MKTITRREFLQLSAMTVSSAVLSACASVTPTRTPLSSTPLPTTTTVPTTTNVPPTLASATIPAPSSTASPIINVSARKTTKSAWQEYATRTLSSLPGSASVLPDADLDQYGGIRGRAQKATGFFRTEKIDGRWWLVDPEGNLFLNKGIVAVEPFRASPRAQAAFREKFASDGRWANEAVALLLANGFNGLGAWSGI